MPYRSGQAAQGHVNRRMHLVFEAGDRAEEHHPTETDRRYLDRPCRRLRRDVARHDTPHHGQDDDNDRCRRHNFFKIVHAPSCAQD